MFEVSKEEWDFAKQHFLSNKSKLSHKSVSGSVPSKGISHSFIQIKGKIYALARSSEGLVGIGTFGKVKLIKDEKGNISAIKIANISEKQTISSLDDEQAILSDLELSEGTLLRADAKKYYVQIKYLGPSLYKIFRDARYDLEMSNPSKEVMKEDIVYLYSDQLGIKAKFYYFNHATENREEKIITLTPAILGENINNAILKSLQTKTPLNDEQKKAVYSALAPYDVKPDAISEETRFDIAIKFCLAVDELHKGQKSKSKTQYAHFDIKPHNATYLNGEVHLVDFGMTEVLSETSQFLTQGTALYASKRNLTPEQHDTLALKRSLFLPTQFQSRVQAVSIAEIMSRRLSILTPEMLTKYSLAKTVNTENTSKTALQVAAELISAQFNIPMKSPSQAPAFVKLYKQKNSVNETTFAILAAFTAMDQLHNQSTFISDLAFNQYLNDTKYSHTQRCALIYLKSADLMSHAPLVLNNETLANIVVNLHYRDFSKKIPTCLQDKLFLDVVNKLPTLNPVGSFTRFIGNPVLCKTITSAKTKPDESLLSLLCKHNVNDELIIEAVNDEQVGNTIVSLSKENLESCIRELTPSKVKLISYYQKFNNNNSDHLSLIAVASPERIAALEFLCEQKQFTQEKVDKVLTNNAIVTTLNYLKAKGCSELLEHAFEPNYPAGLLTLMSFTTITKDKAKLSSVEFITKFRQVQNLNEARVLEAFLNAGIIEKYDASSTNFYTLVLDAGLQEYLPTLASRANPSMNYIAAEYLALKDPQINSQLKTVLKDPELIKYLHSTKDYPHWGKSSYLATCSILGQHQLIPLKKALDVSQISAISSIKDYPLNADILNKLLESPKLCDLFNKVLPSERLKHLCQNLGRGFSYEQLETLIKIDEKQLPLLSFAQSKNQALDLVALGQQLDLLELHTPEESPSDKHRTALSLLKAGIDGELTKLKHNESNLLQFKNACTTIINTQRKDLSELPLALKIIDRILALFARIGGVYPVAGSPNLFFKSKTEETINDISSALEQGVKQG